MMTRETPASFVARWLSLRDQFVGRIQSDRTTMDFSGALLALKAGYHVTRAGWNAPGMFVMFQAGYPDGIPINQNTAEATGLPQGTMCAVRPYLQLCIGASTGRPELVSWVPSISDVLASDWLVREQPGQE